MATKEYYATGDFRYQTRMLRAGEPVEMTAPKARLYKALGKIADKKATRAKVVPTTSEVLTAEVVEAPKPKTAKPQLDHDGDGKAGGSKKGSTRKRTIRKAKAKK